MRIAGSASLPCGACNGAMRHRSGGSTSFDAALARARPAAPAARRGAHPAAQRRHALQPGLPPLPRRAGPKRTEAMDDAHGRERVLDAARAQPARRRSSTSRAARPSCIRSSARSSARRARSGARVIDRCNLTVLVEPGQEDTAAVPRRARRRDGASLPCYTAENVDGQRGRGVFDAQHRGAAPPERARLRPPGAALVLDLVYNPSGPSLPPAQAELEARLPARAARAPRHRVPPPADLTNMPIARFAD